MLLVAGRGSGIGRGSSLTAELVLNIVHRSLSVILRLDLFEHGSLSRSETAVNLALHGNIVIVDVPSFGFFHGIVLLVDVNVESIAVIVQFLDLLLAFDGLLGLVGKSLGPARIHPSAHPISRLDEIGLRCVAKIRGLGIVSNHA